MVETLVAAGILLGLVVVLIREVVPPAPAMVGALVLFVLVGILPPDQAFLGLANPATISIAGLYVVTRTIRDHAGLDTLVTRFLGDGSEGPRPALARLVPTVTALSGFMNNTPLVAASAPVIRGWAERHGVAATKLLMPLSFAAIIGGTLTVIGTAPNLVVSGMLQASGLSSLSFFELTPAGLPVAVLGGAALILLAPRLLPDRRTPHEQVAAHERDYTVRLRVVPDGALEGATIGQAGLRDLPDAFVANIMRDGLSVPATPQTRLHGDDELVFVGGVTSVPDLLARPGLEEAERAHTVHLDGDGSQLIECIVSQNSSLVGSTMKKVSFRGHYGGAVIALHRASERVQGKLGTVELRAGDALLVLADSAFVERWQGHRDFALVIPHDDPNGSGRSFYRWLTVATFGAMVLLAATGLLPILTAILLACTVLMASRAISFGRAIDSLDLDILLIVAAAIGLGGALEASGLAGLMADVVGQAATATNAVLALAVVAVGTMVLTEFITNVAAAALMMPIAIDVAERVGTSDPTGFAVAVALAASASFLTPVGYQTNTIVYGLGGYRFGDYWRLGLPMAGITMATILVVIPLIWM